MIAYVPLLVALAGLLLWLFAQNAKVSEAGRLLFFAGALVFLFSEAHHVVKLGSGK